MIAGITDNLKTNRLLHAHAGYYCKEMRIIAYSQLLESYRSVQLESMATAFGVTVEFLDRYTLTNNSNVIALILTAESCLDS